MFSLVKLVDWDFSLSLFLIGSIFITIYRILGLTFLILKWAALTPIVGSLFSMVLVVPMRSAALSSLSFMLAL